MSSSYSLTLLIMANKQYKVVKVIWEKGERVEIDINCEWKSEQQARKEMRELSLKNTGTSYSITKFK